MSKDKKKSLAKKISEASQPSEVEGLLAKAERLKYADPKTMAKIQKKAAERMAYFAAKRKAQEEAERKAAKKAAKKHPVLIAQTGYSIEGATTGRFSSAQPNTKEVERKPHLFAKETQTRFVQGQHPHPNE